MEKEQFMLFGRKILLSDMQKKLMKEHEELGIMRDHSDSRYELLILDEALGCLNEIGDRLLISQQDMNKSLAKLAEN